MPDEVAVNPDAAEAAAVYLFAMERTLRAVHREAWRADVGRGPIRARFLLP
jgi:hypothetical protein